ncbi:hypothetical protein KTD55_15400 [Burkholderia gladioli]|uniref:hypothetical protein n=1 Tax=Burkholderia gladioli TaxID=28095 RepID=UPI00064B43CD|nr:hypothetical protein [Burkholderia gladioli]MBU9215443.1 hypothetical protein [Burkholderia gladioli]MDN7724966.1 hypothetical protein [Burkholderia gladioli]
MKPIPRPLVIVAVTAMFSAVAWQFPGILSKDVVRYLSAIFGGVTTVLLIFFNQMNSVTGIGVLTGREMERYTEVRSGIRQRFWYVLVICLICGFLTWVLSTHHVSRIREVQGAVVGLLIGIGINYLFVVFSWINDLWSFADQLRLIEQQKRDHEASMKRLADASK